MSSVSGGGVHTTAGPEMSQTSYSVEESGKASSWLLFATILLAMDAVINAIWGIAAISKSHFFVGNTHFVVTDLKTWGWIMVGFAVLEGFAALSIIRGGQFGRWFGIAVSAFAIVAAMLNMPAYPFWSLALIAVYVLVIYGLAVYGGKPGLAE
jgi:hypothetical protein